MIFYLYLHVFKHVKRLILWLSTKESACNAGDAGGGFQSRGLADALEEGMATHSSIHAWEILWTEEPGRLQSMGSQRVRYG